MGRELRAGEALTSALGALGALAAPLVTAGSGQSPIRFIIRFDEALPCSFAGNPPLFFGKGEKGKPRIPWFEAWKGDYGVWLAPYDSGCVRAWSAE